MSGISVSFTTLSVFDTDNNEIFSRILMLCGSLCCNCLPRCKINDTHLSLNYFSLSGLIFESSTVFSKLYPK